MSKFHKHRKVVRYAALLALALSFLLPDHVLTVLTVALSLLSEKAQRYLRSLLW